MAHELNGYVVGNVPSRHEEYFLNVVIQPIYNVLYEVAISLSLFLVKFKVNYSL